MKIEFKNGSVIKTVKTNSETIRSKIKGFKSVKLEIDTKICCNTYDEFCKTREELDMTGVGYSTSLYIDDDKEMYSIYIISIPENVEISILESL